MSCVVLLGVLPRIPSVISEISAAPEAHFQPATSLIKEPSLGASTTQGDIFRKGVKALSEVTLSTVVQVLGAPSVSRCESEILSETTNTAARSRWEG